MTEKEYVKITKPEQELANAVVLLAISDYREALQNYKKSTGKRKEKAMREIESIEAFFESKNGFVLSQGHNKEILQMLLNEFEEVTE